MKLRSSHVFFLNMMGFIFLFCFLKNRNQLFLFINILLKMRYEGPFKPALKQPNGILVLLCKGSDVSYLTF